MNRPHGGQTQAELMGVDKRKRKEDVGVHKGRTIDGYYSVQNVAWQKVVMEKWMRMIAMVIR